MTDHDERYQAHYRSLSPAERATQRAEMERIMATPRLLPAVAEWTEARLDALRMAMTENGERWLGAPEEAPQGRTGRRKQAVPHRDGVPGAAHQRLAAIETALAVLRETDPAHLAIIPLEELAGRLRDELPSGAAGG